MADFYDSTTYPIANTSDRKNWLRRIIIAVGAIVVLIVAATLLVNYLTKGRVAIRSSDTNAKITLISLTSGKQIAKSKGTLSVTVHTGSYTADVTNSSGETQRVVTVKAHNTSAYTINPLKTTDMEPVSDSTAKDIIAGKSQVLFINSDGKLSSINSSNDLSVVNPDITFNDIQWADSSYGVGQDKNGSLYSIENGVVKPMNLSVPSGNSPSLYALAPNHQLYVSAGKFVYKVTASGRLQKIYSADLIPTLLLAGDKEVVVVCNNSSGEKQNSPIAIVSSNRKIAKKNLPGVFVGALSPNGKYIALSTPNGGEILDSSLARVAYLTVTKPGISTPVWVSDTSLAYGNNENLWLYNLKSQVSQLASVAPGGGSISELSLSDDGAYLYGGATHIDGSPVIKRFGLHKQPVPSFLYTLQSAMPYSGNDFFMTLTNFTSPVITVQPFTPLTNTNGQYLQEATSELQKLGVDTSQVQLKLSLPS